MDSFTLRQLDLMLKIFRYPLNMRLVGAQSLLGLFTGNRNLVFLPRTERRFFGCTASVLVLYLYAILPLSHITYLGYAVVQLFEALCYNPEDRGFDF